MKDNPVDSLFIANYLILLNNCLMVEVEQRPT